MNKENYLAIDPNEQKEILLEMLKYIDNICRRNNINYSLIGGSLIGAIRHAGFIPWDDDIDIILDYANYHKLIKILQNQSGSCYQIFVPGKTRNYPIHFAKLINTKTRLKENGLAQDIENYGLFLDIFCYNNIPDNMDKSKRYYYLYNFLKRCLTKTAINYHDLSLHKSVVRHLKNCYIDVFGYKRTQKRILKLFEVYTNISSSHVMSNNPSYGFLNEYQLKKNIEEYIDAEFEGLKVMIFKNYDEILRTTYGDYMQLPPESERVPKHDMVVWWRKGYKYEAEKLMPKNVEELVSE